MPTPRDVVVHLDRVFLVEAEGETLTKERHEVVAELRASPVNSERVARMVNRPSPKTTTPSRNASVVSLFVGLPQIDLAQDDAEVVAELHAGQVHQHCGFVAEVGRQRRDGHGDDGAGVPADVVTESADRVYPGKAARARGQPYRCPG